MGLKAIYEASRKENTQQDSSEKDLMLSQALDAAENWKNQFQKSEQMIQKQGSKLSEALKLAESWKSRSENLESQLRESEQTRSAMGAENLKRRNKELDQNKQIEELQKEIENLNSQIKSLKSRLESEARACKDEETLIREKATAMYNEHKYFYDLKYRAKVVSHESFLFGCLLYGILVTLFTAVRSERFMSDFKTFFETIKVILNVAAEKLIFGASTVAKLGDKIPYPTFSLIVHWTIMFAFMAFIVGGIGFITYFLMYKLIQYYKSDLADNISLTVVLVTMAVEVFFAEKIRAVIPINLLLLFLIIHLAYIAIRAYVRSDKKKRGILPST